MTTTLPASPLVDPIRVPCTFVSAVLQRFVSRHRRAAEAAIDDEPLSDDDARRCCSVRDLALLARLSRAVAGLSEPEGLLVPGSVIALRVSGALESRPVNLMQREVLPTLAMRGDTACPKIIPVMGTGWSRRGKMEPSDMEDHVAKALERGDTALLLLGREDAIPTTLHPLVTAEVEVSDLAGEDIVAMLVAMDVPSASAPDLRASLPADAALAALSDLHLAYAWAAPEAAGAAEVVRRIRAAMEWSEMENSEDTEDDTSGDDADNRDVPDLRLADLHGLGGAADLLWQLVEDVTDWRDGHLAWADVGASMLLSGPSGVGKTSIASALAGEIGGSVVDLSYTTLQAAGHLGQMLGAMEKGVARARSVAPCVVLIDECDDLANRRGGDAFTHNSRYMRSTVNAYLQRLTELAGAEGVVVILATNHPNLVDPALIRAGRVDHHVRLHLPDRIAMGTILSAALNGHAVSGLAGTDEWSAALDALTGGSGADAAQLARDAIAAARVRARRNSKERREDRIRGERTFELGPDDLATAVSQRANRWAVAPDLYRLAVHEAGHIVVGHVLRRPVISRAWVSHRGAGVMAPVEGSHTSETARAELACLLASRSAERVLLGSVSSGAGAGGRESDLAKASTLAARIAGEWHLETTDAAPVWRSAERHVEAPAWSDRRTTEAVERLLLDAQAHADALVTAHREVVECVAEALVQERELDGERIAALLADVPRGGSGS